MAMVASESEGSIPRNMNVDHSQNITANGNNNNQVCDELLLK